MLHKIKKSDFMTMQLYPLFNLLYIDSIVHYIELAACQINHEVSFNYGLYRRTSKQDKSYINTFTHSQMLTS